MILPSFLHGILSPKEATLLFFYLLNEYVISNTGEKIQSWFWGKSPYHQMTSFLIPFALLWYTPWLKQYEGRKGSFSLLSTTIHH